MINHQTLREKHDITSKQLGEKIFNLGEQTFIIPKEFAYHVVEISEDYIARPDLVSLQSYGTDAFTDLICKLNGISNPFELNEGERLLIPEFEELYRFYYSPNADEIDKTTEEGDSTSFNIPVAKKSNTKRTPNEAIIGDERFKIDVKNRVIIY